MVKVCENPADVLVALHVIGASLPTCRELHRRGPLEKIFQSRNRAKPIPVHVDRLLAPPSIRRISLA